MYQLGTGGMKLKKIIILFAATITVNTIIIVQTC